MSEPLENADTEVLEGGESETVTLTWKTDEDDIGTGVITVTTMNDTASTAVVITDDEPSVEAYREKRTVSSKQKVSSRRLPTGA